MKYNIVEIGIAALELDRMANSSKPEIANMAKSIKNDRTRFYQYVEIRRTRKKEQLRRTRAVDDILFRKFAEMRLGKYNSNINPTTNTSVFRKLMFWL